MARLTDFHRQQSHAVNESQGALEKDAEPSHPQKIEWAAPDPMQIPLQSPRAAEPVQWSGRRRQRQLAEAWLRTGASAGV
jgi:hypothetical protein